MPEFRPMINIFWSTEFGYVQVWQNVAGSIRTTPAFIQSKNWVTIHNDLLLLANEYLKKYPPLPATKYADFGPEAAKIMKNIDLNKLPQLTKKQDI